MLIAHSYPPNIKQIVRALGDHIMQLPRVVFTYGHIIYNPHALPIDECVGLHEAQHSLQQDAEGGAKRWWKRYLKEPGFRLSQELEAYGVQYRRYAELNQDRNKRARYLFNLASDLASEQYGKVVSLSEAQDRIRAYV